MTRFARSPSLQIGVGLALAAFAQLLSLFLVGAGHGWLAPLPASLWLWVLTPLAFLFAWPGNGAGWKILLPMLLVAVVLDAWLINRTIAEDNALPFYLEVNGLVGFLIVGLWIGLWLLWQGIVLASLFIRKVEQ
ncbi:MAG TPA: hypothetical protein VGD23_08175 [Sphingomicrobium sp.]